MHGGVKDGSFAYHPFMIEKRDPELLKLGENIARWRKKRGLSQDDLALEAKTGRRTINRIEVGERDVRFSTLTKIAKTLEIKVKDLIDF